jgi:dihydrofolate synthase/folylpolyglutamate synthase
LERLRTLHPQMIDLSLTRIDRLLERLSRPEWRLPPVIHVAGTNGKGSTIAFLRAMAEAAGLRAHVYTSPHLVRFAERIRLAGELISEEYLTDLLTRIEAANTGEPITFFEVTTAAALLAFAETPADLCLVEVGLGGRYDATNVIERPAITVIAPVALDHCEFLGDTIGKIAEEKAGIIKAGVPCISARQPESAAIVIREVAARAGSMLMLAGRDFDVRLEHGGLRYQDATGVLDLPAGRLAGAHQVLNAGLAVAVARTFGLPDQSISEGLRRVSWPARMQPLTAGPLAERASARGADLWIDGAHNPHAFKSLAQSLRALREADGRPLVVILGVLANKDLEGIFAALRSVGSLKLFLVGFDASSAADPALLLDGARAAGLCAEARPDVSSALDLALSDAGPPPRVVICGSLYLAGEVLALDPETWPR